MNEKIIDQISEFHNEWVKSEHSKKSQQCYTVRDLNISIKSIEEGKPPKGAISCFYCSRYDKNVYGTKYLKEKYPDLYKDREEISDYQ
jgi:hypothetical protein